MTQSDQQQIEKRPSREMPMRSFRIDDATWQQVAAAAADEGVSSSEIVRRAVAASFAK